MRRPPSGGLLDGLERQPRDVDQPRRALDVLLHQVDQVGAAGDELRRRIGRDLAHRVGDVVGARVLEVDHDSPHRLLDRRDDVGIGAAAADVAAHQLADLVGGLRLAFGDQAGGRADLARRAVAALEGVVVDEGLLQRMQRAVRRQAFDGGDLRAVLHHRQREAGIDAPAVDQHRAGAALAVVAALLGAGEVEMVAQRVEQGRPRRDLELRSTPLILREMLIFVGTGIVSGAFRATFSRAIRVLLAGQGVASCLAAPGNCRAARRRTTRQRFGTFPTFFGLAGRKSAQSRDRSGTA